MTFSVSSGTLNPAVWNPVYTIQPIVKPVQQRAECLYRQYSRLFNRWAVRQPQLNNRLHRVNRHSNNRLYRVNEVLRFVDTECENSELIQCVWLLRRAAPHTEWVAFALRCVAASGVNEPLPYLTHPVLILKCTPVTENSHLVALVSMFLRFSNFSQSFRGRIFFRKIKCTVSKVCILYERLPCMRVVRRGTHFTINAI